ncbi:MAG: 1,4-dihydroxy-2-naphthoate octaprenyltransferase [Crocinitomicaceae bacterium]|nr:1,4-dihydroxy-2-naphthoate octaprenyltransferase [Crocinitomicaceae bacterium]
MGAMRLRTLPLAAASIIAGSAVSPTGSSRWPSIFSLALLTTLLLQVLSNLANDYGDFSHGLDSENRIGPQRAMQGGKIGKNEMKRGLLIVSLLTLISGILLLYVAFSTEQMFGSALLFLLIGFLAIGASIKYTAGHKPYGYRGWGDMSVFLFFGIIGVCGTAFLHTKSFDPNTLLPALTIGCLSTAVLNLNNLRDHENDRAGGKITLVVKMGYEKGKRYHLLLLCVALLSAITWLIVTGRDTVSYIILLPFVLLVFHAIKVMRCKSPAQLDSELKKVALSTFTFALLLLLLYLV